MHFHINNVKFNVIFYLKARGSDQTKGLHKKNDIYEKLLDIEAREYKINYENNMIIIVIVILISE